MIPEELKYTHDHEWVLTKSDTVVSVGITDFAQQQLGDVVFVEVPAVGTKVEAGEPFGEIESTKSVSELYAPVSGEVVAVNDELTGSPEMINTDPYGEGWIVEIRFDGDDALGELLDATAYTKLTTEAE